MVDTILVISRKNGNFRRNVRIHEAKYYLGNSKSKRSIGIHEWWDTINICIYFFFFFSFTIFFPEDFSPKLLPSREEMATFEEIIVNSYNKICPHRWTLENIFLETTTIVRLKFKMLAKVSVV